MNILNTEIEFDFYDSKQMEKLEANFAKITEEINNIDIKKMKQSQFINRFCTIIEKGFDNIFGEGTSKAIFKGKKNFRSCVQAFRDLVKGRQEQEKELDNEVECLQNEIETISYDYSTERIK